MRAAQRLSLEAIRKISTGKSSLALNHRGKVTNMNRTSKTIAASMLLAASPVIVASGAATTPLGALAAEQRSLANNVLELEAGQLVAKINDSPLYAENLMVLNEQLQASIPPHRLIERMVELRLIADKARQEKLTSDPLLGAEIQNAIDNALATAYLKHFIAHLELSLIHI